MKQELVAFEQKRTRKAEFNGEMYYSVLDVIEHFTKTVAPQTEWARLKRRNFALMKMCKHKFTESSVIYRNVNLTRV